MVSCRWILLLSLPLAGASAASDWPPILTRLTQEAAVFEQKSPQVITEEHLVQRAYVGPSRGLLVRPTDYERPHFQLREVDSQYSPAHLKRSQTLVEFREVTAVDGKTIRPVDVARRALKSNQNAPDDTVRTRMLESLAKFGLVDVATDFGLILAAFTPSGMHSMQFTEAGESMVGTDEALRFDWWQNSSNVGALDVRRGKAATHHALRGVLWVRKSDGLPLRIFTIFEHAEKDHVLRDQATIEYVPSAHGFLVPASVAHIHVIDGQTITENLYTYQPFRLFQTDTTIRYTGIPGTDPGK